MPTASRYNALEATGAVIPPRHTPLVVGINAFVAGTGGAATAPRLSRVLGQTGARWLREEFHWSTIEPTRGTFNFAYYDHLMVAMARANTHVVALLDTTPQWAGPNWNTVPADASEYAQTVARFAGRYGPGGAFWAENPQLPSTSAVTEIELWNEPYYDNGNGGDYDPRRYARLVRAAVTAARAVNPSVRFLLEAETTGRQTGRTWTNWVDALYAAMPDLNAYFDGVSVHPYGEDLTGLHGMGFDELRRTEVVHRLFASHGAGEKPLWITEVGWPTCDSRQSGSSRCTTPEGQRASLAQLISYVLGPWASFVRGVFVYHYDDLGTDERQSENFYGLVSTTGTPKPALALFRAFAATSD